MDHNITVFQGSFKGSIPARSAVAIFIHWQTDSAVTVGGKFAAVTLLFKSLLVFYYSGSFEGNYSSLDKYTGTKTTILTETIVRD